MEPLSLQKMRQEVEKGKHRPRFNVLAMARRNNSFMDCFVADPGKTFFAADVSSLEPTVSAEFSQDEKYCYATRDGLGKKPYISSDGTLMIDDVYLLYGSKIPGMGDKVKEAFEKERLFDRYMEDPESVTKKHPIIGPLRQIIFKPGCLGLERGMGWKRLRSDIKEKGNTDLSKQEAKSLVETFWRTFDGLALLAERLKADVEKQGFFTTPFGVNIHCEPHKALAFFTQSVGMGVIDLFAIKLYPTIGEQAFIMHVHDETAGIIKTTEIDSFKTLFNQALESLNKDLGWKSPIRMIPVFGKTFAEIK